MVAMLLKLSAGDRLEVYDRFFRTRICAIDRVIRRVFLIVISAARMRPLKPLRAVEF
jgi:hypothetical protein